MSEQYRFFDSIDGEDERFYTADEFAEYFRQFIRNGIFTGGENLKVASDEIDMNVLIKEGYAWLEGYLYKVDIEPLSLTLDSADPALNRIDRIVIRLDKSLEKRYVKAFILKGSSAESPKPPTLTRDENIYELSLAQVQVIGGKSFIENYQITDERLNSEVCGIVTHLFEQVDTTEIFNQFQSWYSSKTLEYKEQWRLWFDETTFNSENEFNTWIQELKDRLKEADVTYLDSRITETNNQIKEMVKVKKDITLLASSWIDNRLESGFYTYDLFDPDIDENTVVDVNVHLLDLEKAGAIQSSLNSFNGYIRIYADDKIEEDINIDLKLVRQVGTFG